MIIRGKAYWAKVLGEPVKDKYKPVRQWSMDVAPDEASLKALEDEGLSHKIKPAVNKSGKGHASGQGYVKFERPESVTNRQGKQVDMPNIPIVDKYGQDWPDDKLLGNGTEVEVAFEIIDGEFNGQPFRKPRIKKIKVVAHVPFEEDELEYEDPSASSSPDEEWDTE